MQAPTPPLRLRVTAQVLFGRRVYDMIAYPPQCFWSVDRARIGAVAVDTDKLFAGGAILSEEITIEGADTLA